MYEVALVIAAAMGSAMFVFLASHFGEKLRMLQALFLFIGIFLIDAMFTLTRTIAVTGEASAQTLNLIDTSITVATYAIYISLVFFVISVAITALQYLTRLRAR